MDIFNLTFTIQDNEITGSFYRTREPEVNDYFDHKMMVMANRYGYEMAHKNWERTKEAYPLAPECAFLIKNILIKMWDIWQGDLGFNEWLGKGVDGKSIKIGIRKDINDPRKKVYHSER